jgi:hypothetical protein
MAALMSLVLIHVFRRIIIIGLFMFSLSTALFSLTVKSLNSSFPWSLGVDHNRVQVVNTLLLIREVTGSNVGPETSCPD